MRNVVERTVILAPRDRLALIEPDMLPSEIVNGRLGTELGMPALMGSPLREARENFEREYLRVLIRRFPGIFRAPPASSAWSGRRCIAS